MLLSVGCAAPPGPTVLEPAAEGWVEVVVDNRWDRSLAVDLSTPDGVSGILEVAACEVANMTGPVDPPFAVGYGPIGDRGGRPMPAVITSDDLMPGVDGGYRVLVRVASDGSVSADDLVGPPPVRAADRC